MAELVEPVPRRGWLARGPWADTAGHGPHLGEDRTMHLSTHNWMRAESLAATLARIGKFGCESIEISGEPAQYDVAETRRLLTEHGIRCWAR